MLNNINLGELSALEFVLSYISVKELLTNAVIGFSSDESEHSQDNADLCTKTIQVFLK